MSLFYIFIHSHLSNACVLSQLTLKSKSIWQRLTKLGVPCDVSRCSHLLNSQHAGKWDYMLQIQNSHLWMVTHWANFNIDIIDWTQMNLDIHMPRWKQRRSLHLTAPLISWGMLRTFSRLSLLLITFYFVLRKNAQRSWPYAFTLGSDKARLCASAPGTLQARLSGPCVAKAPPVVAPGPPVYPSWPISTQLWLTDSPPSMCRVS